MGKSVGQTLGRGSLLNTGLGDRKAAVFYVDTFSSDQAAFMSGSLENIHLCPIKEEAALIAHDQAGTNQEKVAGRCCRIFPVQSH